MLTAICFGICFAGLVAVFIKPELISMLLEFIDSLRDKFKK